MWLTGASLQAFLEPYRQFNKFRNDAGDIALDEFMDAKEVVQDLSQEYQACEHADYVSRAELGQGQWGDEVWKMPTVVSSK